MRLRLATALAALAAIGAVCVEATPAAAAPQPAVAFGAYLPKVAERPQRLDAYARLVGRRPVLVSYYRQWDYVPFEAEELDAIWNRGAVPMITWEPLSYQGRDFPLAAIQRGRFDPYVREAARAAAAWGKPILLRFAHEMNGGWYPWGRQYEDNNSHRVRAVWRRVVDIFRTRGADNVQWVWTPNVNTGGSYPFRDLYPGDEYVDWIGFDGFNWALRGEWNSFTDIVDNTYEELAKVSSRPMIVGETGSAEDGGDKAAWVRSAMLREIPRLRRIRAVVWFEDRFEDQGSGESSELDSRAKSSPASLRAFRRGIASPLYGLTRAQLLATPKSYAKGPGTAPAAPDGDFGQPSLLYRLSQKLHGPYLLAAAALAGAAILVLIGILALLLRRRRRRAATA